MFLVFIFTRGCSCAVARRGCLLVWGVTTVPVRRGVRVEVLQTLLSAEGGAPEGDAAACSRTFGARLPSLPWEPIKFLAVL